MTATVQKRLITAREAEAYIPPLERFAGNYRLKEKLLGWLRRPVEHDPNLLVEGEPGTGKTSIIYAYLREQFHNPWFFREDFTAEREAGRELGQTNGPLSLEQVREWQDGGRYYFQQINGATDSEARMRGKLDNFTASVFEFLEGREAVHKVCVVDEIGEVFFRGFDEALRPTLTEPGVTTYATAQNFHSKRKTDSFKEEDQRLVALLRRFSHRERTEPPTGADHLRFLVFLVGEWGLKVDEPATLRLLVEKSEGVVGLSKRILIRAIDEPGRRVTRKLVEEADVFPV